MSDDEYDVGDVEICIVKCIDCLVSLNPELDSAAGKLLRGLANVLLCYEKDCRHLLN